jgi:parallel beta-helix repeat protein
MRIAARAWALGKKTTLITTAFVLAVSTLTAAVPFILSQRAGAAPLDVCASGCAYTSIQEAINLANAGDTISVASGVYNEKIDVNKAVSIIGAGAATTRIVAPTANDTTVNFGSTGATVSGFTITHEYTQAEKDAWDFNNMGVNFNGSGNTLSNSTVLHNRNGIYINQRTSNKIINNVITDNRTGIHFAGNVNGTVVTGNTVSNNWTLGLVYYDISGTSVNFSTLAVTGNTFTGNWYSEILVKDAPGASGVLDVEGNTFTDTPVTYSTSADASLNEPGFASQRPVSFGGAAVAPSTPLPTLRIYNSAPAATISYDSTAPSVAATANGVALPENLSTSPKTYIRGQAQTTFVAQLTDSGSAPREAYIEFFQANWDGSYGNWRKDNTSAGDVRYGSAPQLTVDTSALNGRYGLKVVASDTLGNTKTTYHYFTIDNKVPTVTVKPAGSIVEGSSSDTGPYTYVSFKLFDEDGNLKEVVLNGNVYARGGTWNDLNWSNITASHLQQGTNTIIVRDYAGNESNVEFVYDTVGPVAPTLTTPDWYVTSGFAKTLSWAAPADNDVAYYEYAEYNNTPPTSDVTIPSWMKVIAAPNTTTTDTAWQSNVTIYWRVRAVDTAGNKGAWSETRTIVSDYVDPTASVGTATVNGDQLSVSASASDDLSGVQSISIGLYDLSGNKIGDISNQTFTDHELNKTVDVVGFDLDDLPLNQNGTFEIRVSARDWANNESNVATTEISVFVDRDSPEVTISSISTTDTTPLLSGTVDDADPNTTVVVSIDGEEFTATNNGDGTWSYQVLTPLTLGTYVISVIAEDSRVNVSSVDSGTLTIFAPVLSTTDEPVVDETSTDAQPQDTSTANLPLAFGPAANFAVLGTTTDVPAGDTEDTDQDVQGATTDDIIAQALDATNNTDGSVFGLAWYWWLAIIGGAAVIIWGVASAIRGRQS